MNNDKIKEIEKAANIVDIISSYISLEKKGANYVGLCPFHNDSSPSFTVSPDKGIYTCWVCKAMNEENATGKVFNFVEKMEGVSFLEAVKIVADKVGIEFNGFSKKTSKYDKYYEAVDLALKFYHNNLKTEAGLEAVKYLDKRKINDEIIDEFFIGYAPNSNDTLTKILLNKGYSEELLIDAGLANMGTSIHDFFKDRITFPIHDINGNPVGFSSRIYKDIKESKYINTKESVIFKKGNILFNFHRAKSYALKEKELIIVEGQMDAIRAYASGIKNVIALMGTALTTEHINVIKKLNVNVVLCLDNDNAGLGATIKNGELLSNHGINTFVLRIDGKKDVDEYIIEFGKEKYIDALKNKISFFEFKLNYLKTNKDLNNAKDIASYVNSVIAELNKETDEILINATINKISDEYNIDKDILFSKIIKKAENNDIIVKASRRKISNEDKKMRLLLYYMMNDEKYIELYNQELSYLPNEKFLKIAEEILAFYLKFNYINVADFITYLIESESYEEVLDILDEFINIELSDSDYLRLVNEVKTMINEERIKKLQEDMKNCSDINQKLKLMNEVAQLKIRMCNE